MLTLSSLAFADNGTIPEKYTCDSNEESGAVNPPLVISGVPEKAESLVLIMDDPDIPQAVKDSMHIDVFDHWVIFDIPPETKELGENRIPPGVEGANTLSPGYTGPCPPDREHRYFFKLFALDTMLGLPAGASRADVEEAMKGHVVEFAELVGRYNRLSNRSS